MVTCPRGHSSTATDYCDECGAPIGGGTPGSGPVGSAAPASAPPVGAAGEPCPDCGTVRAGRFCEVCGRDFLAESGGGAAPPPGVPGPCTTAEAALSASPGSAPPGSTDAGAVMAVVAGAGAGTGWRVIVTADREYYERMRNESGPDAQQVAFPAYCPQRRFELTGTQLLIGRRSRSRGVEPELDLTGPPEDAGVSHMHALLVAGPDGGWSVVDLDSANGTYVNSGTDQIAAHTPVPLDDGDTVHVGAWTTLIVQRG